jgi:hypothetical protein
MIILEPLAAPHSRKVPARKAYRKRGGFHLSQSAPPHPRSTKHNGGDSESSKADALPEDEVSDRESVSQQDWQDNLSGAIRSLGRGEPAEARRAVAKLAERLEASTRRSTEKLIELHNLSGTATAEVLRRISEDVATSAPAREGFPRCSAAWCPERLAGLPRTWRPAG